MTIKTLLGYTRKSIMDDDSTTPSPDRQRSNMDRWAAAHGYQVEHYQDLDISGRYESNRPGWQSLLQRLDDPTVAGVITESLDRIYRNRTEFGRFKQRLDALGKQIIFTNMPGVDGSTAQGNLFLGITAEVAEFESRVASERMAATIHYLKNVAGFHWGRVLFGCDLDANRRLIPSARFYYYNPATGESKGAGEQGSKEAEKQGSKGAGEQGSRGAREQGSKGAGEEITLAPPHPCSPASANTPASACPPPGFETRHFHDALVAMYQLYATGQYSYSDVAQRLNASGWRNWEWDRATPKPFILNKIRNAIELAPLYGDGEQPILPVELCAAVAAAQQKRATVRNPGNTNRQTWTWLLTGILRCATCGGRMAGQRDSRYNRHYYYRHLYFKQGCPEKSIPAFDLESQIIDLLMPIALADLDGIIAEIKDILREAGEADNADLVRLRAKEQELERLIDLHVSGLINREQFERRQTGLQVEISEIKSRTVVGNVNAADFDHLIDRLLMGISHLGEADRGLQRIIIHSAIESIQVADRKIVRIIPTAWARPFFELVNFAGEQGQKQSLIKIELLSLLEL